MGFWAQCWRFAHNEAKRNDANLVGARGRAVRTSGGRVRRGPSPWWVAGRREASGLPGAPEVGLISGGVVRAEVSAGP